MLAWKALWKRGYERPTQVQVPKNLSPSHSRVFTPPESRVLARHPRWNLPKEEPSGGRGAVEIYGPPANSPSMGFVPPTASPGTGSDLRRAYLARLCCASRFSQPRDALFRPYPLGLVSCRIRPWGSALRGFPLPVAVADFAARCPFSRMRRPEGRRVAQGFKHLGGPFTTERFYPASVGRSSLSLCAPLRISPLEPWPHASMEPPLMGFTTTQYRSVIVAALQSVKEHEGRLGYLRVLPPSLGFMS